MRASLSASAAENQAHARPGQDPAEPDINNHGVKHFYDHPRDWTDPRHDRTDRRGNRDRTKKSCIQFFAPPCKIGEQYLLDKKWIIYLE